MNTWSFNNDELFDLVKSGRKTATCWLANDVGHTECIGDIEQIINSRGQTITIQITSISVCRFADVDETWAAQEGEGDLSLTYWQNVHKEFFKRVCNTTVTNNTKLVCMGFKLI